MDAFWTLSYPVQAGSPPTSSPSPVAPSETLYLKGPRDVAVVFTCFLLFSALRELSTFLVFKPIARRWVPDAGGGGTSEERAATASRKGRTAERDTRSRSKASVRFAEQGWSVLYYVVYWSFGLSLFLSSPSYRPGHLIPFDFHAIWSSYPLMALTGPQKFYYLSQAAFWFHQVVVLNVEARRKDHYQMLSHHAITISLVIGSYLCNHTSVGIVVLILMDPSDILFSSAKMLKYLGFTTITDAVFGVFVVSWLVTRQIGLLLVIISIYEDLPRIISFDTSKYAIGPYDIPFNRAAWWTFLALLTGLWILICIWFVMICRVVWKVLLGESADDVRSDADEDEVLDLTDDEVESEEGSESTRSSIQDEKDSAVSLSDEGGIRKRR